jgi:KaiC/GvpD/RAD55 family RecA-like ATPase
MDSHPDCQGHPLVIARGEGVGARITRHQVTWGRLIAKLRLAQVDDLSTASYQTLTKADRTQRKARYGYVILADFGTSASRNNAAVIARSGWSIDVEGSDADLDLLATIVDGVECVVLSTRSSAPGDRRWRIVGPYARPHAVGEHRVVVSWLLDRLDTWGVAYDRDASLVESQPAFLPTVSNDQEYQFRHLHGDLLDVGMVPKDWQARDPLLLADDGPKAKTGISREELERVLAALANDGYWVERREGWLRVGMALHHEFSGSEDGLELWDQFSQAASSYDPGELRTAWGSFKALGSFTVRGLVHAARALGYEPAGTRLEEIPVAPGEPTSDVITAWQAVSEFDLPARRWVLGHRFIRGFVSALVSQGGVGKSVLSLTTAVALATGRDDITGEVVHERTKVWVINAEDDKDEMDRRMLAICKVFGVDPAELEGWLFIDSWYGKRKRLVGQSEDGSLVPTAHAKEVARAVRERGIGVLIIDPLVALHTAEENSNDAMQQVMDVLKAIAGKGDCALGVVHHAPKGRAGEAHAGDADMSRGATAVVAAARVANTLVRMGQETADRLSLPAEEARRYIRLDDAKSNYALPDAEAHWFRLESVSLANGDSVGVPVPADVAALEEQARAMADEAAGRDLSEWRIQICEAMDQLGDRVNRNQLTLALAQATGQARISWVRHIEQAVEAFPMGVEVTTESGTWLVTVERDGDWATAPKTVVRRNLQP